VSPTRRPRREGSDKPPVTRQRSTPDTRGYLCGRIVQPDDKIVRVHETTVHHRCYDADIRRGR
jgi:hypothetical protein